MQSELEKSQEIMGRILAELVGSGLRRVPLAPEDFGLGDDRVSLLHFMSLMEWLKDEGLIRYAGATTDGFYGAVQLTAAGIVAVDNKSFENGRSVRSEVEAKKAELSAGAFTKIGAFVGGLMGGAAKTLGG